VSGPTLDIGRPVVEEMVRLAALEVPGILRVGRGGFAVAAWFAGPPIKVRVRDGRVDVRLWVIARPAVALPPLARQVSSAVGAAVERLLGLQLGSLTVVIDGVGG
jgi:uncharacterized alkaline shock family protein YloU